MLHVIWFRKRTAGAYAYVRKIVYNMLNDIEIIISIPDRLKKERVWCKNNTGFHDEMDT